MVITEKTRISEILKHDEHAIEVIASINSHFRKLKNPFLRKILAPRVTVEQAAKIGNIKPEVMLQKLSVLDFKIGKSEKESIEKDFENFTTTDNLVFFDVRPILSFGNDPLKEIMKRIKKLNANETLVIINSFEPIPLIHLLQEKGFISHTENIDGIFHTYFTLPKESMAHENKSTAGSCDYLGTLKKFSNYQNLDVSELEMPGPMVEILNALSDLPPHTCLKVNHRKIPNLLFPILKEKGFEYALHEINDHHIEILIYQK